MGSPRTEDRIGRSILVAAMGIVDRGIGIVFDGVCPLDSRIVRKERKMYATKDYRTKKELKTAVKAGPVPCHQPGPFGPNVTDGSHACEGPHYPKPHRWYATVTVKEGRIVAVK